MQPHQRQTKRFILLGIVALVILIGGIILFEVNRKAPITLEFTPKSASATINGQPVSAGTLQLKRGTYTIKVTKDGFYDSSKKITVSDTREQYAGLVLTPSTGDTNDWYSTHSEDETLREKISGKSFNDDADASLAATPLVKLLPYTDPDDTFRIDYGSASGDSAGQTIYITVRKTSDKAAALKWITGEGYDPDDYTIRDIINPLLGYTPHRTTDYLLNDVAFYDNDGTIQLAVDVTITLSSADNANKDAAVAQYKEEVLAYMRSKGANPDDYVINYTVN